MLELVQWDEFIRRWYQFTVIARNDWNSFYIISSAISHSMQNQLNWTFLVAFCGSVRGKKESVVECDCIQSARSAIFLCFYFRFVFFYICILLRLWLNHSIYGNSFGRSNGLQSNWFHRFIYFLFSHFIYSKSAPEIHNRRNIVFAFFNSNLSLAVIFTSCLVLN